MNWRMVEIREPLGRVRVGSTEEHCGKHWGALVQTHTCRSDTDIETHIHIVFREILQISSANVKRTQTHKENTHADSSSHIITICMM